MIVIIFHNKNKDFITLYCMLRLQKPDLKEYACIFSDDFFI